jgi:hypothetical protein
LTHPIESFVELLQGAGVEALARSLGGRLDPHPEIMLG